MTEVELIESVAESCCVSKSIVADVLRSVKQKMQKTLARGESVVLSGFGTFQVKKLKKKPLFGKPQEGTWTKVRFSPSRRRQHGKVRRSDQ